MNKRNQYSAEFKTKVVLEVLQEESTINEIAAHYGISPVVISRWKAEFLERASEVFKKGSSDAEKELAEEKERAAALERKVGQLIIEVDWLKKNLTKLSGVSDRKAAVEPEHPDISVKHQTELQQVNRSSVYRKPIEQTITDTELFIICRIDEIHTDEPTWGYRTITRIIRRDDGLLINRKRVKRIMRDMGIYSIYPKPNLSKRYHSQYIRPYLLRNLSITHPNQVWGIDITYIRMQKGFMYLFVIIDWHSRYIVNYELSSTLDKFFVLSCLKRALAKHKPEIINSDQVGHFTNPDYIKLLEDNSVKISMDGKGQCRDNARTERFFRTLKYDRIYIYEYESPRQLRVMLRDYIHKYNTYRPHSSINGECPAKFYFDNQVHVIAS